MQEKKIEYAIASFSERLSIQLNLIKCNIALLNKEQSNKIDGIMKNLKANMVDQFDVYQKSFYKKSQVLNQIDEVMNQYLIKLENISNLYNKMIVAQMARISDIQIKMCLIDMQRLKYSINDIKGYKEQYFRKEKNICLEIIEKCEFNIEKIKNEKEIMLNQILESNDRELIKSKELNVFQNFFDVVLNKLMGHKRVSNYILKPMKNKINKIEDDFSLIENKVELMSKEFCVDIDSQIKNIPDLAVQFCEGNELDIDSVYFVDKVKNFADIGIVTLMTFAKESGKQSSSNSSKNICEDLYNKIIKNTQKAYFSVIKKIKVDNSKAISELKMIKSFFEKLNGDKKIVVN